MKTDWVLSEHNLDLLTPLYRLLWRKNKIICIWVDHNFTIVWISEGYLVYAEGYMGVMWISDYLVEPHYAENKDSLLFL